MALEMTTINAMTDQSCDLLGILTAASGEIGRGRDQTGVLFTLGHFFPLPRELLSCLVNNNMSSISHVLHI